MRKINKLNKFPKKYKSRKISKKKYLKLSKKGGVINKKPSVKQGLNKLVKTSSNQKITRPSSVNSIASANSFGTLGSRDSIHFSELDLDEHRFTPINPNESHDESKEEKQEEKDPLSKITQQMKDTDLNSNNILKPKPKRPKSDDIGLNLDFF